MRRHILLTTCAVMGSFSIIGSACQPTHQATRPEASQIQTDDIAQESARLNAWFQDRYEDELARSPMSQSYLGMKDNHDRLDDVSQLADDEQAALTTAWLKDMRENFETDRLDPQTRLSYRLYEYTAENALRTHAVADHDYVFQHMSGPHSSLPSFLINFHAVDTVDDMRDYIARLNAVQTYMGQYSDKAQAQFEAGVSMPKFVYGKVITACENVISGAPFSEDSPENSPLWDDVQDKIAAIETTDAEKDALLKNAREALLTSVKPAYESLIAQLKAHEAQASEDDGAWKLPNAADYYATRLKHYTTTDLTPDEIHQIGLDEVARIQAEMQKIMEQVGFDGSLKDFYTYLREDPQFAYANDDPGRERYITEATAYIDDMRSQLDDLFITQPKADMVVKRVEPFRQDTAFGAYYNRPALDGSRPGIYYINMREMKDQPTYLMQALAYHEGIPGHHMQIALAMELEDLPKFRTLGGYTSYVEGWALYAESVPKDLGLYIDPYKDFGRLSMEIFRAARLVVDTGVHTQKWTRDQAVEYMLDNIANAEGDIRAEVDRYIVWPGQATAYKIGMIKIQDLRSRAEAALGEDFNIAEFHDAVLVNGAVPLEILDEIITEWIESKTET